MRRRSLVPLCESEHRGKNTSTIFEALVIKPIMNSAEHFEALVSEHYQPLFRFAMSLTRVESDALDLTQHTFYTWAAKGHQLRDGTKVKTWLFTTLHRAFLADRRRQTRFPHQELEEESQQLPVLPSRHAHEADCAEVLRALAKVDDIYHAALALFYMEDCPYKEIAMILDIPLGTVKSRIARGIAQLREILLLEDSGASSPDADAQKAERQPPAEFSASDYDEWDFSSTRVGEQFSAA